MAMLGMLPLMLVLVLVPSAAPEGLCHHAQLASHPVPQLCAWLASPTAAQSCTSVRCHGPTLGSESLQLPCATMPAGSGGLVGAAPPAGSRLQAAPAVPFTAAAAGAAAVGVAVATAGAVVVIGAAALMWLLEIDQ